MLKRLRRKGYVRVEPCDDDDRRKLLFGTGELLPTILIGAGRLGTAVSSFISRDTNGYRLYSLKEMYKLNMIRDLRRLNFSMEQIKAYLEGQTVDNTLHLLRQEADLVQEQLRELRPRRCCWKSGWPRWRRPGGWSPGWSPGKPFRPGPACSSPSTSPGTRRWTSS